MQALMRSFFRPALPPPHVSPTLTFFPSHRPCVGTLCVGNGGRDRKAAPSGILLWWVAGDGPLTGRVLPHTGGPGHVPGTDGRGHGATRQRSMGDRDHGRLAAGTAGGPSTAEARTPCPVDPQAGALSPRAPTNVARSPCLDKASTEDRRLQSNQQVNPKDGRSVLRHVAPVVTNPRLISSLLSSSVNTTPTDTLQMTTRPRARLCLLPPSPHPSRARTHNPHNHTLPHTQYDSWAPARPRRPTHAIHAHTCVMDAQLS
jgi:hypothetical protein